MRVKDLAKPNERDQTQALTAWYQMPMALLIFFLTKMTRKYQTATSKTLKQGYTAMLLTSLATHYL